MKRAFIVLTAVLIYVVAVWSVLVSLPFLETPMFLKTLFAKNWQSIIVWMKIRHTFSVVAVGSIVALFLVRYDNQTAKIDALIIGVLSVVWALFLRLMIGSDISLTWIEISDFVAIGLAIPVVVVVVNKVSVMANHHRTLR
jgi:hypothetical protein